MNPQSIRSSIIGIALSIAALGAGAIISLPPTPMTYDDMIALNDIYNYEIQRAGGTLTIQKANGRDMIENINDAIRKQPKPEGILGEGLRASDYLEFREKIFELAERKSLIQRATKLDP